MNKKRILIGLILLLTLINLSAIITFSYNKYQKEKKNNHAMIEKMRYRKDSNNRIKRYVRKELQLNDNQFNTYCRLKDENFENSRKIIQKIAACKKAIITEINKKEPDSLILVQFSDSIGIQHKFLQMETNRHFLAVKSILTTAQTKKFEEMLIQMDQKNRMKKKRKYRNRQGNMQTEQGHRYRNGNWE